MLCFLYVFFSFILKDNIAADNIAEKIAERYTNGGINLLKLEGIENNKLKISCKKCNHSWETSIKNALVFYLGCYDCHKGKNYSMDEIKILRYIQENYIPNDLTFKYATAGGQHVIKPKESKAKASSYIPPLFYQCDGFSRKVYEYCKASLREGQSPAKDLKILYDTDLKGTVFEVLGDFYHSNPLYYKPHELSPKKGIDGKYFTHKQNYEYTMNRMKHIEELGYKVFYIWVTDFRRFTWDLEKGKANIFDYMNIDKSLDKTNGAQRLLYKGSRDRYPRKDSFTSVE